MWQRAGIDFRKVVLARGCTGHKQPSRPHTKVGGEKRALPRTVQPPQRDRGKDQSDPAQPYCLKRMQSPPACRAYGGQIQALASKRPICRRKMWPAAINRGCHRARQALSHTRTKRATMSSSSVPPIGSTEW